MFNVKTFVSVCALGCLSLASFGIHESRASSPASAASEALQEITQVRTELEQGDLRSAYTRAARAMLILREELKVDEVISRANERFKSDYQEVVTARHRHIDTKDKDTSAFASLFFSMIDLSGHKEYHERHKQITEDTLMVLRNPEKKAAFDEKAAVDANAIQADLAQYVRENADAILALKTLGALALRTGTALIQQGERYIVRIGDLQELARYEREIRFEGEQAFDLCVDEKFAAQYFQTFSSTSKSMGGHASVFILGRIGAEKSRRETESDETWKKAYRKETCTASSKRFEVDANSSSFKIDFRVIDRITEEWLRVAQLTADFGQLGADPVQSFGNPYLTPEPQGQP